VAQLGGGSITVETGREGEVRLQLLEQVFASSDRDADEVLRSVEVQTAQERNEVRLIARQRNHSFWRHGQVRFTATLTVPANVRVDLGTSGGSIRVRGERSSDTRAETSGGGITIDGGTGNMTLDTSGGSIRVGTALTRLDAGTSGGGITVGYVGPKASNVVVETSGGSIRVGIDRHATLNVSASASGGHVDFNNLGLETSERERSSVVGVLNGGGGVLRATTSGGGIDLSASQAPRRPDTFGEEG
jgi:hypothetical protein